MDVRRISGDDGPFHEVEVHEVEEEEEEGGSFFLRKNSPVYQNGRPLD